MPEYHSAHKTVVGGYSREYLEKARLPEPIMWSGWCEECPWTFEPSDNEQVVREAVRLHSLIMIRRMA